MRDLYAIKGHIVQDGIVTVTLPPKQVPIDGEVLQALRSDYETLRRFVVSLAENEMPVNVSGAAIDALTACSVTYLPIGHPDRSH